MLYKPLKPVRMQKIGIRHEDKYLMERRVPLIPAHVQKLTESEGIGFIIESSGKRVFTDSEYTNAGAVVSSSLKDAGIIMGVKEIPVGHFETGKTYIFFSHVIKGQSYNMPMLKDIMDSGCSLIDYEKILDDMGRRLIFFGRYAGLAGMINSLWSLGKRLGHLGMDTPFKTLRQAHKYASLDDAKEDISRVGMEIAMKGLPKEICPLTVGFTGYGNVSNGAQEIAGLLPVKEISPAELLALRDKQGLPDNVIYKTIFYEKHLSRPRDPGKGFELPHYYAHPEEYEDQFARYIPHLSVLMNCMYWDEKYPRIVTKDYLEKLFREGRPKLTVIGDITCDPNGSIECTHKGTEIDDPVFVYNPFTREPAMGFEGEGILVMAVDILPSELPRESSIAFSNALYPYMKAIAQAAFNKEYDDLVLPDPIKKALIVHKGKLTPDFEYISQYLDEE